jgi:hypothetical protein
VMIRGSTRRRRLWVGEAYAVGDASAPHSSGVGGHQRTRRLSARPTTCQSRRVQESCAHGYLGARREFQRWSRDGRRSPANRSDVLVAILNRPAPRNASVRGFRPSSSIVGKALRKNPGSGIRQDLLLDPRLTRRSRVDRPEPASVEGWFASPTGDADGSVSGKAGEPPPCAHTVASAL